MNGVFNDNLFVIGKNLDLVEDSAIVLLDEMFPETCTFLLDQYEKDYNLKSTGGTTDRRNRIIAAIRNKGGLSISYLEGRGNDLGSGSYTIVITEGSGVPFIVHTSSPPASVLPAAVYNEPFTTSVYTLTVTVTGVVGPEADLEGLLNKLKPAWTNLVFVYV